MEDGGFDVHREASTLGRGLGVGGQVEGAPADDVLPASGLTRQPLGPAPEGEGDGDDLLGLAAEVPALGDGAPDFCSMSLMRPEAPLLKRYFRMMMWLVHCEGLAYICTYQPYQIGRTFQLF